MRCNKVLFLEMRKNLQGYIRSLTICRAFYYTIYESVVESWKWAAVHHALNMTGEFVLTLIVTSSGLLQTFSHCPPPAAPLTREVPNTLKNSHCCRHLIQVCARPSHVGSESSAIDYKGRASPLQRQIQRAKERRRRAAEAFSRFQKPPSLLI